MSAVLSPSAVADSGLLVVGRPVVVLLSGGRDSTALLDLAVSISGALAVHALHLNYSLRVAANSDEEACRELCARLGVELSVERPRRPEGAGNLQAWAREVRYRAAATLAAPAGADIAVGHTASDQVETILYRLASSPSRRALLGMSPRDGAVVRPLLPYTRAQTAAYCLSRGLPWVEDESNATPAFARNRIRAHLLPAFEEVHPAAVANVLAVAEILRDEAEVLEALVEETLAGRSEIELVRLRGLRPALRRLVVQHLADRAAGGYAPGAARRADEVADLREHGVAELDLPYGVRARVEGGVLRFTRTPHAHAPKSRPSG